MSALRKNIMERVEKASQVHRGIQRGWGILMYNGNAKTCILPSNTLHQEEMK
jgi:hypothetical protein